MLDSSEAKCVLSIWWGPLTIGSSLSQSMSNLSEYSAFFPGVIICLGFLPAASMKLLVVSSTSKKEFLAPQSTDAFAMQALDSRLSLEARGPPHSRDR